MATIFKFRKAADDAGSGGKIMRGRRAPEPRSPYSRPPPPPPPSTPASPYENPSRLLGLISPASRIITGAAKMVSSVFFPDSPPDSSSSSEDDNDDDDMASQGDDKLNQDEATLEADMDVEMVQKKRRILAIEQLLMQETLSRDESNKLVKIIESRVVDFPARIEGDASRRMLTDRVIETGDTLPVGGRDPDICSSAVLEAKKWVEEKKTEPYPPKDKSPGTFISSSCMRSNITEGEQGSPVLMAKSYMKSRPPWASPTATHIVSQASPIGRYLSKEETPHSIGGHAMSSSKVEQRSNLAIQSGNILDGPRRDQTEDSVQPLTSQSNTLKDEKTIVEADEKDGELGSRMHSSDSLPLPGSVKQSKHSPEVFAKNNGPLAFDTPEHEASSNSPDILANDHNQKDLESTQIILEGGNTEQDDSRSKEDQAKQKEQNSFAEGFVNNEKITASSLSAKVNAAELSTGVGNKVGRNVASSSGGNWEGSCELISETFVEVPGNEVNPTTGSTGQSMEPSLSNLSMKRRMSPRVKKPVKYSRRGRGRGK